ncbi:MAG: hypothetical protein JW798_14725 [Prolixibacteraceae bacterium]|nr:hypothetical protein [Prolixibacteraceae bacterium]
MKKSIKLVFIISFNFLFLVACVKDDIVQNNAIVICSDITNKHIFNLDSTKIESGPREIKTFELDVNQDNINDIQITTDWDIHPGGGYCKSEISCINNSISLCVYEIRDTTFINNRIDTVYSGNEVYIHYNKTYS